MSVKPPPTEGNTIKITACDNEIIILAYYDGAAREGSYELCRILNGFNNPLNVTLNLSAGTAFSGTVNLDGVKAAINTVTYAITLPADQYKILLLGVNWGGGQQYAINVNGTVHGIPTYVANGTPGLVYKSDPLPITV